MRLYFASLARPKRASKSLRRQLAAHGIEASLVSCYNAVARMAGYAHWQDLQKHVGTRPPSPDDAEIDVAAVEERHQQYVAAIVADHPQLTAQASAMALAVGLTSGTSATGAAPKPVMDELFPPSFLPPRSAEDIVEAPLLPFEVYFHVLRPENRALLTAAFREDEPYALTPLDDDPTDLVLALADAHRRGLTLKDLGASLLALVFKEAEGLMIEGGRANLALARAGMAVFDGCQDIAGLPDISRSDRAIENALWQADHGCKRAAGRKTADEKKLERKLEAEHGLAPRPFLPLRDLLEGLVAAHDGGATLADLARLTAETAFEPCDGMELDGSAMHPPYDDSAPKGSFQATAIEGARLLEDEGPLAGEMITQEWVLAEFPFETVPTAVRRRSLWPLWQLDFLRFMELHLTDEDGEREDIAWDDNPVPGILLAAHRAGHTLKDFEASFLAVIRHDAKLVLDHEPMFFKGEQNVRGIRAVSRRQFALASDRMAASGGVPVGEIASVLRWCGTMVNRVDAEFVDAQIALMREAASHGATLRDLAYLACWRAVLPAIGRHPRLSGPTPLVAHWKVDPEPGNGIRP